MAKATTEFKTRYNFTSGAACPTGTEYDKTYEMSIDEHGHKTLKYSGRTNRYAKIQAHKDETEIETIIKRSQMDPELKARLAQGNYMDTTNMPKTLAEAQNMMIKAENEFKSLPLETRAKFDHSLEKYIAELGTEKWAKIIFPENFKKIENIKEEHVKEPEKESEVK